MDSMILGGNYKKGARMMKWIRKTCAVGGLLTSCKAEDSCVCGVVGGGGQVSVDFIACVFELRPCNKQS